MSEDSVLEIIVFIIGAIIWAVKSFAEATKSSRKKRSKKPIELPEYSPYETTGKRKYVHETTPSEDFVPGELTLEEMIQRGLIEVVDDNGANEVTEYVPDAPVSDYVENLNAFAENLSDNTTYARNEAPVCEVEELEYEENVHNVDYAEFIRQNGKAAIIISEIILPANSKMRK
ncbi:MAG: hypothetical protein IJW31_03520 [Lentisphaeria bacterium]|nr:hypothetical protein [Lentisphaeria bacterium]